MEKVLDYALVVFPWWKRKKRRISSFGGVLSPAQVELSLGLGWVKVDQKLDISDIGGPPKLNRGT